MIKITLYSTPRRKTRYSTLAPIRDNMLQLAKMRFLIEFSKNKAINISLNFLTVPIIAPVGSFVFIKSDSLKL